jgi:hypothetical protein
MAKCKRCEKRKAKRFCPALGISLCNLCCGQIRQKEVHCPSDCPHLSKHTSYQEKRTIEKKMASSHPPSYQEGNVLEDERLAWLALHIETPIKEYGEKSSSFSDKEALMALEFVRERIERKDRLILLPEEKITTQNALGEAIFQMIEKCRYEGRVILAGAPQKYTNDEKLRVVDYIIASAKNLSRDNIEGRRYIQSVMERFSRIRDLSRQKKITMPS